MDADSRDASRPAGITDQTAPVGTGTTAEKHSRPESTAADMPPGGRPRPNTPKREADLGSLLSPGEKTELVTLISTLTESMLQSVTRLFDPPTSDGSAQPARIAFWTRLPYYLRDLSLGSPGNGAQRRNGLKENVKPSRCKNAGRAADKVEAVSNGCDAPGQEEDGLTPRLQELKKEALQHFRKWQTAVHKRVGDISVKKAAVDTPSAQLASSGPRRRSSSNRSRKPGGGCQAQTSTLSLAPGLLTTRQVRRRR